MLFRRVRCSKGEAASLKVGAAPHLPAGILSPYSDGERDNSHQRFRQSSAWQRGAPAEPPPFLPVTIRGEMPGRAMRGSTAASVASRSI
ncbi:hypothetical protein C7I87_01925 [Mesorhizobium sp. SARCC-RB16n]|nr:hypothetical protein C7I87_01925 [Mesorhizobium sp. SARCC-RB16n]